MDDIINAQYAGAKARLRPLFEQVMAALSNFGGDVEVAPRKAYVSLRRRRAFAILQPSTATRIDIGINLPRTAPTERLEVAGSFNPHVSHRVRVMIASDVDAELLAWLRKAYDAAR
jgi:hypothetical protein